METAGPRTQVRVPQDTGRHQGLSDPGPSRPGQLVEHAGLWTRAQNVRDIWWNPRAIGPGPKWRGTVGRPCWPLDLGPSHAGQLLNPMGIRARVRVAQDTWSTVGPQTRTRVAPEIWSTPRALGQGPESLGTAGRSWGHSDPIASPPGHWSTPKSFGPGPQSSGTAGRNRWPLDPGLKRAGYLVVPAGHRTRARVARDSRSTPLALQPSPESTKSVG